MAETQVKQVSLQHLSEEHAHLLQLCSRIRAGLERNIQTRRIRKYTDWFRQNYLDPHFAMEEQVVFPILQKNVRVKRALANHRRITRLLSCSCEDSKVLSLLEEELTTYIRFEERVLFREISAHMTPAKLEEIKNEHQDLFRNAGEWEDPFWI